VTKPRNTCLTPTTSQAFISQSNTNNLQHKQPCKYDDVHLIFILAFYPKQQSNYCLRRSPGELF